MKKIVFLMLIFLFSFGVRAQENSNEYIYSEDGFEIKEGIITVPIITQDRTFSSTGLYSKDGKILVSAIVTNGYNRFYVIDGCETISSRAFQGMTNMNVYIPSSVKNIAPDAIISSASHSDASLANRFAGIQDGCREDGTSNVNKQQDISTETIETARFTIDGLPINQPTHGINILKKSDGTSEKVLVK